MNFKIIKIKPHSVELKSKKILFKKKVEIVQDEISSFHASKKFVTVELSENNKIKVFGKKNQMFELVGWLKASLDHKHSQTKKEDKKSTPIKDFIKEQALEIMHEATSSIQKAVKSGKAKKEIKKVATKAAKKVKATVKKAVKKQPIKKAVKITVKKGKK